MSTAGTGTLYQPPQFPELKRTPSNTTHHSLSSDVHFFQNGTDVKIVLQFTQHEISLIRTTWQEMISDDLTKDSKSATHTSIASSLFCIQFYANLLAMEPELEKMFPSIKHQAISFSGVLSTAILNLESLEKLDDYLNNLGKRHARILGIDPPHFELMGVALLKTFQDRFGINFSLELERCWARLYTYLANSILQFGIDPILKVEKLNSDIYNLTQLERTSTDQSTSQGSLFDQRSISTANTTPTQPNSAISTPFQSSSSSATNSAQQQNLSRTPRPLSSLPKKDPRDFGNHMNINNVNTSKLGKRVASRASRSNDDKDCVIM